MEYGHFIDGGKRYEVLTPQTPAAWGNPLFNDTYYMELDQMLQGSGQMVKDYNRFACICKERYFYLADRQSGEVWNPNFAPLGREYDTYSCVHGLWNTELKSSWQGIETGIMALVPQSGTRELWSVSIQNRSEEVREISLYTMFGFYDHGVMGGECVYDDEMQVILKYAFPYHTLYKEKEKAEKEKAYFYFFSDRKPDSYDMSSRRFFGNQGIMGVPQGIKNGTLSGIRGEAEDFCGALAFHFCLQKGEQLTVCFEAGAAVTKEEVFGRRQTFDKNTMTEEMQRVQNDCGKMTGTFYMETPDENLNAFGNYWLKKQITLLTRQNRGSSYCPVRNQLQDAMGYAMIAPKEAGVYFMDVVRLQRKDGSIRQWHDTTGAAPRGLCLLNHTDGPVWLAICTETYIRQNGAGHLLSQRIPYSDGDDGTLMEHMTQALFYLFENVGVHGLCLMGDGDWNDPINGVGRNGKGESVWLSMALVYAVNQLLPYLGADSQEYRQLYAAAENMKRVVNEYAWDGRWYAVAIHDDGRLVGGSDDRLFLNTQTWAVLSDIADEKKKQVLTEALERLKTPFGPLILYPPFDGWDARWGRISVKKSGTTENGSVYCHASMFLAYAQAKERDADGLYETIWRTLPTNAENMPAQNGQIPTYLPNYYYGLRESDNFGRSSRHYGTGTAAWMMMLVIEELLGAKASVDGLCIQPLLPEKWDRFTYRRQYREAVYEILVRRGDNEAVYVDGCLYDKEILPYQEGRKYQVECVVI